MRLLESVALGCLVGMSLAAAGHAQGAGGMFNRDQNVSVTERPRPEYDTAGIQRGAFVYSPRVQAQLDFNDNIYATASNEQSDTILIVRPSVNVSSTWSRHSLEANASITRRHYFDFSDESTTDASIGVNGGLDLNSGWSTQFGAGYDSLHEPRTAAGIAGRAVEPIAYDTTRINAGAQREMGRVRFSGGVSFNQVDYESARLTGGNITNQDDRDRDEISTEFRAGYAVSPDTAVFGRVRLTDQDYTSITGGTPRDQNGFTIDAGANFDLSNLVRGEIGVGYYSRSFDAAGFSDVDGLSIDGQVEWFVSPLTTVSFNAARALRPSAIAGSPTYLEASFGARVDHELLRNLILNAGINLASDDYEGVSRHDDRSNVSLGGTYLVNRYVGVSASFVHSNRETSGTAGQQDFEINRLLIGVVLQR